MPELSLKSCYCASPPGLRHGRQLPASWDHSVPCLNLKLKAVIRQGTAQGQFVITESLAYLLDQSLQNLWPMLQAGEVGSSVAAADGAGPW